MSEYGSYGGIADVTQFWFDNLACEGNETYVGDCPLINHGISNCIINETAGVKCAREWNLWCDS